MALSLATPGIDQLGHVVTALRDWQRDSAPIQLHPGDLGWYQRFGAARLAGALRTWSRGDELVAIGFLDGPSVLRMTVAPDAWHDEDVARRVVADLSAPERGVLPAGEVAIEAPDGTRIQGLLDEIGWRAGEAWAPLRRDLDAPVEAPGLRIEVVGAGREPEFTAVHRSAWGSPTFTDELWRAMAAGPAFVDARCLLGYADLGTAVAGVTVWSAGPGKPGLLEPMGVHADHRGRGHGRGICLAAAAELQALGSSSALVCTTSSLTSAVATYRSAGFEPLPERLDRVRDA
ncbi:GNAT family N-acetyltransferase [Cellulomonas rhizosphaerae]|uniref:GNAT family N-acetyltransferase n=1 Tax=Cellulomonas rhizosphaerae TaxID=2293719 RepID=A0A413RJM8_9CELL|nr:GNAT family N-acetyltransferase [Cellulomonas rhizosphaerae]RHA38835.1 GNAT family N-acetyltransferase [Cellulomonas rhizosphaerae]